jgi:hypothetical protein
LLLLLLLPPLVMLPLRPHSLPLCLFVTTSSRRLLKHRLLKCQCSAVVDGAQLLQRRLAALSLPLAGGNQELSAKVTLLLPPPSPRAAAFSRAISRSQPTRANTTRRNDADRLNVDGAKAVLLLLAILVTTITP